MDNWIALAFFVAAASWLLSIWLVPSPSRDLRGAVMVCLFVWFMVLFAVLGTTGW